MPADDDSDRPSVSCTNTALRIHIVDSSAMRLCNSTDPSGSINNLKDEMSGSSNAQVIDNPSGYLPLIVNG
jgi:hypothetical protein